VATGDSEKENTQSAVALYKDFIPLFLEYQKKNKKNTLLLHHVYLAHLHCYRAICSHVVR
jgi:hypothetical protein